jgi:hypothetical protein
MATVSTFLRCVLLPLGHVPKITQLTLSLHSPIRVVLTPGLACMQVKLMVTFLLVFSLSFLAWSRGSKSMSDFRMRHVCWHIVSATALAWLAWVEGSSTHHVPLFQTLLASARR